ncbi:prenyltransferase/squalene oxidase repeat-containing protein [Thermodesulfovibrio sp. TK110]
MDLRKVLYECYQFVMQRRKQDGGFAATPLLPATVEDTYHALKIIKSLKELGLNINYKPDEDKTLKLWLYSNKKWNEPKVFYQLLRISMICNVQIDKKFLKQYMKAGIVTLERAFYLSKISELIDFQISDIGKLSEPRTVKDLYMFLYLSCRGFIKERIEKNRLIEYFKKCQNPDGGYGFSPGTTSYVDNTYFCLKALDFLGSLPEKPKETLEFILYCQTKSGGFARTPNSAAFLDSTFYAVESLTLLKI